MRPSAAVCLLPAAALVLLAAPVRAGEIDGVTWFSGVASVAGTAFPDPVDPANDDVAGSSPNVIVVTQKDYVGIGPVDLVFDVIDNGGVTEYLVMEGVQNSTGLDWSSYHIELGFGVGAGFVKSAAGDGLDFDAPDYNSDVFFDPSPGFFPTVSVSEDDIIASGGVMPSPSFAGNFLFHIDVPDGISAFTLRQSPIAAVPEPAMAWLLASALAGLAARKRIFSARPGARVRAACPASVSVPADSELRASPHGNPLTWIPSAGGDPSGEGLSPSRQERSAPAPGRAPGRASGPRWSSARGARGR